jgi:hypothetical protein
MTFETIKGFYGKVPYIRLKKGGLKMLYTKKRLVLAGMLATLSLLPVRYSDCGSTATASPASEDDRSWVCKNLELDWNYVFHPDRINQCKPREIKDRGKMVTPES